MKHFLKLIDWPSLLLLIVAQFLIKYALFAPFGLPVMLNWFGLALLSLSTVSLAAAGQVMQAISKSTGSLTPTKGQLIGRKITEKSAYRAFVGVNLLGVAIGFYLANIVGYPSLAILFILTAALLHAQASGLKNTILVRPLILSLMMGLSLLAVGLFDLFPAINDENRETIRTFFSVLIDYSIFIGLLVLFRELILGQTRMNENHKEKRNSLSIALGRERTATILIFIGVLPLAGLGYYLFTYLYMHNLIFIYTLVLLFAPLCYILIRLISAKTDNDYKRFALILNFVILFTVLSIALYQFISP